MNLLVLTSEPVSAQQLREAVGGESDPLDAMTERFGVPVDRATVSSS